MEDKISIIIPIYNCELYLGECLNSILGQTYKNWEAILVDDGSTDNSGKIGDAFAKNDTRFKIIHKKNGGVSSARNVGLDIAEGDWIMFVDSDDMLTIDSLRLCLNLAKETGCEIVAASSRIIDINGGFITNSIQSEENKMVNNILQQKELLNYATPCFLPGKLFMRTVIKDTRFIDLATAEDLLFMIDVLYSTTCKIVRTPSISYICKIIPTSLSHNSNIQKRISENTEYSEEICRRIQRNDYLQKEYAENLRAQVFWRLTQKGWFPTFDELDKKHLLLSDKVLNMSSKYLKNNGGLRLRLFLDNFKYNLKRTIGRA